MATKRIGILVNFTVAENDQANIASGELEVQRAVDAAMSPD